MTKKQKVEQFDALAAEKTKWELTTYDLVNHRFGLAQRYMPKQIRDLFGEEYGTGVYDVCMSWRAMPLFLVKYMQAGQADQVHVFTENEVDDMRADANRGSVYARIVVHARDVLVQKQLRKDNAVA